MKDAKGHGSNPRGGVAAHQQGVAQATAPSGMTLAARAQTYHPENGGRWDTAERTYQYGGSNRKAAISWGLKKVQREFPGHQEHSVSIKD